MVDSPGMKPHLLACLSLASLLARAETTITVEAGDFDRHDTPVEFDLPANVALTGNVVLDDAGRPSSLQIDKGHGVFVVHDLKRGASQTFKVGYVGVMTPLVRAEQVKGELTLRVGNNTAFTYHTAKTDFPPARPDLKPIFHRAGYIHPILSPSGLQVTDDYPANHKHHHGLWFSWSHAMFEGRTNDYWNMGDGNGTMEFLGLDRTWNGSVEAGFVSKHQHVDLTAGQPKPALNETWNVRLFSVGHDAAKPYFLFDVDVTDSCATSEPVKLPLYR